jgi:hypothetical protein
MGRFFAVLAQAGLWSTTAAHGKHKVLPEITKVLPIRLDLKSFSFAGPSPPHYVLVQRAKQKHIDCFVNRDRRLFIVGFPCDPLCPLCPLWLKPLTSSSDTKNLRRIEAQHNDRHFRRTTPADIALDSEEKTHDEKLFRNIAIADRIEKELGLA